MGLKKNNVRCIIALIPSSYIAIYRWGFASLGRIVVGVAAAMLTELLIFPLSQKKIEKLEGKWKVFI